MSQPGLDLDALHGYLAARLPDYRAGDVGALEVRLIAGGKSNLTYLLSDGEHRWVLRRPPLGPLTPSAHDMAREYRAIERLAGTGVPVAPVVLLCEDPSVLGVPFSLCGFVEGRTIRSAEDAATLTPAEQRACAFELIDRLAQLHTVDPAAVGLDPTRADGYVERQVRRWSEQWQRVRTRESAALYALAGRLRARLPPPGGDRVIVHGDYRLDNVLLASDGVSVRAIVDWEMSTLGDPLADLGLSLVYWEPMTEPVLGVSHIRSGSNGFPSGEELAGRYAEVSGRSIAGLAFHVALGCFKLAVIAEGIHQRYLAGATVGEGFSTVGDAVPILLQAGLEALP